MFAAGRMPGADARSRSTSASTATSGDSFVVSDERRRYPGYLRNKVESGVIGVDSGVSVATAATNGAILMQWAVGARKAPSRTTPLSTALSNGWTRPKGQTR